MTRTPKGKGSMVEENVKVSPKSEILRQTRCPSTSTYAHVHEALHAQRSRQFERLTLCKTALQAKLTRNQRRNSFLVLEVQSFSQQGNCVDQTNMASAEQFGTHGSYS